MEKKEKKWVKILKGEYLFNEKGKKGWRMVIYIMILLMIMVYSGHKVDDKVLEISKLRKLEKKKKTEFVVTRSKAMRLKLRSRVEKEAAGIGLYPSTKPVTVIHVKKETP